MYRLKGEQHNDDVKLSFNFREDQFSLMDRPWISGLRFTEDPEQAKRSMSIPPKPTIQESMPAFYDKNMNHFTEKWEKIQAKRSD